MEDLLYVYLGFNLIAMLMIGFTLSDFLKKYDGIKVKHLLLLIFLPAVLVNAFFVIIIYGVVCLDERYQSSKTKEFLNKKVIK